MLSPFGWSGCPLNTKCPPPVTSQPSLNVIPVSTNVNIGSSVSIDFKVAGLTPSSPILDKDINVYFQVTGATATQALVTGATLVSQTDNGVALPAGCFKATIVGSGQNDNPPGSADVSVTLNTAGLAPGNLTIKIVHYDGVSEEANLSTFTYDPSGQPLLTASSPATIAVMQAVASGQTFDVQSGQTTPNILAQAGSTVNVHSGGAVVDAEVYGTLNVLAGGTADPTTVHSGGLEAVSSGGTDTGALI
jgi:autotransporter passenger strand-loop-strand repeat protein